MTEPATDGRVLRGARNRQAVVDAFLALVEEGDLSPTAQKVAVRAGVSSRSVFHHFDDMEGLLTSAAEAHLIEYLPLVRQLPRTGPVAERIEAFVDQRVLIAEKSRFVYRAAVLVEHNSTAVSARLDLVAKLLRDEAAMVFAGELVDRPPGTIEAVDAAASLDTWGRLRGRQGRSAEQARAAVLQSLTALLS
jgi:AcrR family transcriptional regulator